MQNDKGVVSEMDCLLRMFERSVWSFCETDDNEQSEADEQLQSRDDEQPYSCATAQTIPVDKYMKTDFNIKYIETMGFNSDDVSIKAVSPTEISLMVKISNYIK